LKREKGECGTRVLENVWRDLYSDPGGAGVEYQTKNRVEKSESEGKKGDRSSQRG